jgi:hypothetical protein
VGLAVARAVAAQRRGRDDRPAWKRHAVAIASAVATFHYVCLTWIFFRADSISGAAAMLEQMGSLTTDTSNLQVPVMLVVIAGYAAHFLPSVDAARDGFVRLPAAAQAGVLFAVALGLYAVASAGVAPFIYARF